MKRPHIAREGAIPRTHTSCARLRRALIAAAAFFWLGGVALAANGGQASFASPEQAVDALVAAVRSDRPTAIGHVLGPGSAKLVESGDPVADKADRAKFAAAYDAKHRIEPHGDQAVLLVGDDEWPFPIPLRAVDGAWRFDARAGAEEILNRRIGSNELDTIEVCRAFVDAERDYASEERNGDGFAEYASRFVSSRGKEDGLYWPAKPGAPASPLGPLMAEARSQGYGGHHAPYHGYHYKILTGQGPDAPGGARDYIVRGHMIGGFALVAYPAKWGDSGILTFIVDQDGIVHEKNLGRDTQRIAAAMTRYDPDPSWTDVRSADSAAR